MFELIAFAKYTQEELTQIIESVVATLDGLEARQERGAAKLIKEGEEKEEKRQEAAEEVTEEAQSLETVEAEKVLETENWRLQKSVMTPKKWTSG